MGEISEVCSITIVGHRFVPPWHDERAWKTPWLVREVSGHSVVLKFLRIVPGIGPQIGEDSFVIRARSRDELVEDLIVGLGVCLGLAGPRRSLGLEPLLTGREARIAANSPPAVDDRWLTPVGREYSPAVLAESVEAIAGQLRLGIVRLGPHGTIDLGRLRAAGIAVELFTSDGEAR